MKDIPRILQIRLPSHQSAFLWGPRKTGKSTYLRNLFRESQVFDLLQADLFFAMSRNPSLLRERVLALNRGVIRHPIIIDEVQKVPQLLDEIQWLIENRNCRFLLCGSSARKLKRGHANLLGGRAWRFEMFPLVFPEIRSLDILRIVNHGTIPTHWLQSDADCERSLKAYVQDYLKEEVFAEGLTRNIPAFSRFFDALGYSHGELLNYSRIASDCGVDSKTVKEYFQILSDTLVGFQLEPFKKKQNRQVIGKAPKFYLFDTGLAGHLTRRNVSEPRGAEFGKAFEHFLINEVRAWNSYHEKDLPMSFWRTKSGLEVDLVLGEGETAIEFKGTGNLASSDFRGLSAFTEEFKPRNSLIVCQEKRPRISGKISVLPWNEFLERLWADEFG